MGISSWREMEATTPEKAPTLIKPAWPRLSSPEMTHHQVQCHSHGDIGTDGDQLPLKEGESIPPALRS